VYRSGFNENTLCFTGCIGGKLSEIEVEDEYFMIVCEKIKDEVETVGDRVTNPICGWYDEYFHWSFIDG
jgi:hypothetical protein